MKKIELKSIEDKAKEAFIAHEKGLMVAAEGGEEILLPEPKYRKDSLVIKFIATK